MDSQTPYHSALKAFNKGDEDLNPVHRATFSDGVALCHDAWDPLPPEFNACDALYAEPPWRRGYEVFNQRAGVAAKGTWAELLQTIATRLKNDSRPAAVTVGKEGVKHYSNADGIYPVLLNGFEARLVCYRWTPKNVLTVDDAMRELCEMSDTIGDFCAGFGKIITVARATGTRFVVSDHNASCIAVIAKHY